MQSIKMYAFRTYLQVGFIEIKKPLSLSAKDHSILML